MKFEIGSKVTARQGGKETAGTITGRHGSAEYYAVQLETGETIYQWGNDLKQHNKRTATTEQPEKKEEEKKVDNELKAYCENIRKELNAIYEGTTQEQNDDGEQMTLYDYFADALDYEYTIASTGDFLGVRVYVTLGGPNVWIDTRNGVIAGAWGTDREETWLPSEIADEINDIFREYYEMTRN